MSSQPPNELAQAVALLRDHRLGEARALLSKLLQRDPRSDQAWFLLSLAVEDPRQQRDCLQRALRLNPHNAQARERLAALDAPAPATPPAETASVTPAPQRAPEPPLYPLNPVPPRRADPSPKPEPAAPVAVRPASPPPVAAPSTPPAPASPALAVPSAPARPRGIGCLGWGLIGLLAVAVVGALASAGLWATGFFAPPTQVVVVNIPTPMSFPTLPPTWTASPTPTETAIPSPTPTRTPTLTPTLPPPNPTLAAQMDVIDQQVADLRGLAIQGENPRFLVARHQVEEVLSSRVLSPDLRAELEDQKLVLSVLGLIKPTYDLVRYALNSHADNLGGFYVPWTKEMYVIGSEFNGIERFVYSHEYGHALADTHFDIAGMGVYPVCVDDGQRCAAIRALVEGDATLLMEQWWRQYATPQDYLDILDYEPPEFILPEEFPPPYVSQDLAFPYDYGYTFVEYLHQRGNWAAVNRAYTDLPQSTEHILHPEKYLAGEAPQPVRLPAQPSLEAGWRLVQEDVLGEWLTYLILGYGADFSAQVPLDLAETAAAGWGGDRYQVYHSQETGASVLVARWAWDRPRDADEFAQAMRQYHAERFRGGAVDRADGDCWEANDQASCLFTREGESLWLLAPDQVVLNNVLLEFPDF